MSGAHTILVANALTNVVLAELPVTDVHHSRILNDSGTFEATIPLDDPAVAALQLVSSLAVEPGAVSVYCKRDGTFEWGGYLAKHDYDSKTALLKVTAYEFGAYCAARYIIANVSYNADLATLAKNWITQVFADGGPPLLTNVTTTGTTLAGVFNAYEQHCVLDLLKSYQSQSPGAFDWSFDVGVDGNGNACALLDISFPRRGQSYVNSGIAWDYPGQITNWTLERSADPSVFTTDLFVTGAGVGGTQLQANAPVSAPGYLKLTHVINDPNLPTQAAVNAYATGEAKARGGQPLNTFGATVLGDAFFNAGLTTGDEFTMSIADPYYPFPGADIPVRILGYDVIPNTASMPELVNLTLGNVL